MKIHAFRPRHVLALGTGLLLACMHERPTPTATTTDTAVPRPAPADTMRLNLGFAVPADGLNHDFDVGDDVDAGASPPLTPEFTAFLAGYEAECSAAVRQSVAGGWHRAAQTADGEGTDLADMAAIPFSPSARCPRWRYFACGDLMDAQPDVHERTVLIGDTAAVHFSFRSAQRREMRPFDGVMLFYVWRDEQWKLDDVDCVPETAGPTRRRLWTPKGP